MTRQLLTKGDGRNNMERMVRLEEQNGLGRMYLTNNWLVTVTGFTSENTEH